jgi:type IV secretory pathway VirB10-like protein
MLDDPRYEPVAARSTRVSVLKLGGLAVGLAALLAGGYYAATHVGWLKPVERAATTVAQGHGNGVKSFITYPDRPKPIADGRDPLREELTRLRQQMERDREAAERARQAEALERQVLLKRIEELSRRPAPQPVTAPKEPPKVKRAPMLFTANEVGEGGPRRGTFRLAPGATKLPCQVETAVNSDVGGHFTLKLTRGVWDTATGRHLLIPQGSTVLGHDEAANLVFGNERLPTYALTLALPNGQTVDLGKAPVTGQTGQTGLVSDVNHHWLRNYGAVIISGVLRGGQQVLQTEVAQGGGAGQLGAGIGQSANQFGQQKLGKAIDTRPTITINPGELCQVLLVKPVDLPEYEPVKAAGLGG